MKRPVCDPGFLTLYLLEWKIPSHILVLTVCQIQERTFSKKHWYFISWELEMCIVFNCKMCMYICFIIEAFENPNIQNSLATCKIVCN